MKTFVAKEKAPVRRKVGLDKYFLYFISKRSNLKPNYFKKQRSLSSILLTQGNNTGLNWPGELIWLDPCIDMGLAC